MTGPLSPARSADRWFAVLDGVRLRQLRRQHGLSAAELAGKAGVGLLTVTRLERRPGDPAGPGPWPVSPPRWASLPTALTCSQPSSGHAAR